jgi:hypothetical protein
MMALVRLARRLVSLMAVFMNGLSLSLVYVCFYSERRCKVCLLKMEFASGLSARGCPGRR